MHTITTDRTKLISELNNIFNSEIFISEASEYTHASNIDYSDTTDPLQPTNKPAVQGDLKNDIEVVRKEYYEMSFFASQHSNSVLIFGCSAGENYQKEGHPVQSYSVLLRTIDNAGTFTIPSDVVTIYHDNTSPSTPTISNNLPILTNNFEHTFSIYAEYKSDVVVMLSRLVNNHTTIEQVDLTYFTNNNSSGTNQTIYLGSSIHDDTNNNCLTTDTTNPTRRVGNCTDGLYIISITAVDGAGNESSTLSRAVELDTTSPFAPTIELAYDATSFSIIISTTGEINSISKLTGHLQSGNNISSIRRLNIDNPSDWNRTYTYCDNLTDLAGNTSLSTCASVTTPAQPPTAQYCDQFQAIFKNAITSGTDFSTEESIKNYIKNSGYSDCFVYRTTQMLGLVDSVIFSINAMTTYQTNFLNCVGSNYTVEHVSSCVDDFYTPDVINYNFANDFLQSIKDTEAGFSSYTECISSQSKTTNTYKNVYELASYCLPDNIEYRPGTDLTNLTEEQKRSARVISPFDVVRMSTYTNDKGETKNFADEAMNSIGANINYANSSDLFQIITSVTNAVVQTGTFIANTAVTLTNAMIRYNPAVILLDTFTDLDIRKTVNDATMNARSTFQSAALSLSSTLRYGTDFTDTFAKNYELAYGREYALWDKSVNGTTLQQIGYFSGGWYVYDTVKALADITKELATAIAEGDMDKLRTTLCPESLDNRDCANQMLANLILVLATGGASAKNLATAKLLLQQTLYLGLKEAITQIIANSITQITTKLASVSLAIQATYHTAKLAITKLAQETYTTIKANPELATKLGLTAAATTTAVFALIDDNLAKLIYNNIQEASAGLAMFTGSLDDITKNFAKNTGKGAIKTSDYTPKTKALIDKEIYNGVGRVESRPDFSIIQNIRVRNHMEYNIWKKESKFGSGSVADAIRGERVQGVKVGGRDHTIKGKEFINWFEKNLDVISKESPDVQKILNDIVTDTMNSLNGK